MSEHVWVKRERDKWEGCRVCGVVRRADDKNNPCRGPVKITTRETSEHKTSADCWCETELNYVDPDTGGEVWVHRDTH